MASSSGGGVCEGDCDDGSGSWGSDLPWEFELGLELPEPPNLSNLRIKPKHPCWKWILLNKGIKLLDLASDLALIGDVLTFPSGEGALIAMGIGIVKKELKDFVTKGVTKSSKKRIKKAIKNLSNNSNRNNGISQKKVDQLRRIGDKVGFKVRNDGVGGVRGSSSGIPHVQTEGLGKSIDSRHIWTQPGVQ